MLPDYSFGEYHEALVDASPEAVKRALQSTAIRDVPVIRFLTKIRGLDDKKAVRYASKINERSDTFSTPDFNFFVIDSTEMVTVMLLNASTHVPPPPVKTLEQFRTFNKPGYIKVAINFRFIPQRNGQTLVTTETRNYAMELFDLAIKENVAFVPGNPFYIDKTEVNTCRLNFSCSNETEIEEGIRRLSGVLATLG